MRKFASLAALIAAMVFVLTGAANAAAQGSRLVEGQVLGPDGKVVPGAIVVLVNRDTKKETSMVTNEEGRYRFGGLSSRVSYRVYAYKEGMKSRKHGVSSFVKKKNRFVINIRLKPKEETPPSDETKDDSTDKEKKDSGNQRR